MLRIVKASLSVCKDMAYNWKLMTTKLEVNINDLTHRVFDNAFFEHNRTPEEALQLGVRVLSLLENAKAVQLVDCDGNVEELTSLSLTMPGPPNDIDVFNLCLMQAGSSAKFWDHEIVE
jgi:hypothetical protein